MIITRTPLRISLVGGGTDLPAFYERNVGAVISFSINKFIYVSVNKKFDNLIRVSYSQTENVASVDEVKHDLVRESLRYFRIQGNIEIASISDIPGQGSGLGSSSSFVVGLVNAMGHRTIPGTLAERAFDIEANKCHHPVGKQDHYICAYGGMNHIKFHSKQVTVRPLYYSDELEKHCLLLWTGQTRNADPILREQAKNMEDKTVEISKQLARIALDFHNEYTQGMNPKRIGEYVSEGWKIKTQLADGISTPQIDEWYETGMKNGAYGGKLLGAGGGGFMFFIAPPDLQGRIAQKTNLRRVDFKIEAEGSKVIYYDG